MSEFKELVKQFQTIRTYVRDFYIYGFKSRDDYDQKSGRTYDNERRRIESWFSGYTKSTYSQGKKNVYIAADSRRILINPLYQAWKAKSFTSNDIMLHFFLLDLFWDKKERKLDEIADEIQTRYAVLFDTQTLRKKLAEYGEEGLLSQRKEGRHYLYRMNPIAAEEIPEELPALLDAVKYFQGSMPFGFAGATVLDNQNVLNDLFCMKHNFLVHTLEDEILLKLMTAIKGHRQVHLQNRSSKNRRIQAVNGIPLKILVSTQTGRRYVCLYLTGIRRFSTYRLDQIIEVDVKEVTDMYSHCADALERNLPKCFGVSFGQENRVETLSIRLYVDEQHEMYIVNRLQREGRGGKVTRCGDNEYLYEASYFDCNEAFPWIKTFIGRILSLDCSNEAEKQKFYKDMERMAGIYLKEE